MTLVVIPYVSNEIANLRILLVIPYVSNEIANLRIHGTMHVEFAVIVFCNYDITLFMLYIICALGYHGLGPQEQSKLDSR